MVTDLAKIAPKEPLGCTAQSGAVSAALSPISKAMADAIANAMANTRANAVASPISKAMADAIADAMANTRANAVASPISKAMESPSGEVAKMVQDLQKQDFALKKDNLFLPTSAHQPREIPYTDIVDEREIGDAEQKTAVTKEQVRQRRQDNLAKFFNIASVKNSILVVRIVIDSLVLLWMSLTSKRKRK